MASASVVREGLWIADTFALERVKFWSDAICRVTRGGAWYVKMGISFIKKKGNVLLKINTKSIRFSYKIMQEGWSSRLGTTVKLLKKVLKIANLPIQWVLEAAWSASTATFLKTQNARRFLPFAKNIMFRLENAIVAGTGWLLEMENALILTVSSITLLPFHVISACKDTL